MRTKLKQNNKQTIGLILVNLLIWPVSHVSPSARVLSIFEPTPESADTKALKENKAKKKTFKNNNNNNGVHLCCAFY